MFEGLLLLLTVGLAIYYAPAMIKTWWHGGAWGLRGLLEYPSRAEQQAEHVKRLREAAPVMSQLEAAPPTPIAPVVQGTEAGRTPDAPPKPSYTPEQLLTFYRWLRAAGLKREDARPQLKAMNIPLSNDLWAKAETPTPEPDDLTVTPFAGRVTRRSFYQDDPELEYQPPA